MPNIIELIPKVVNMADSLGFNLKKARENIGLTQPQLADKIGTIQSTISKWENDKAHPLREYWPLLTKTLDLPDGFFDRKWQPPVSPFSIDDVMREWNGMKERIKALEKNQAPSISTLLPLEVVQNWNKAGPTIQSIVLYLLSGESEYKQNLAPEPKSLLESLVPYVDRTPWRFSIGE